MTILIYETEGTSNFLTLFKDSADPKLFYFVPKFATLSKFSNGRLKFGAHLFRKNPADPADGFAVYNFACSAVVPTRELQQAQIDLEARYGAGVRIVAITPDAQAPSLKPLTDGIYKSIKCQSAGIDLFTDLACSFNVTEDLEPDMRKLMQTPNGWTGYIDFAVRTKKTSFDWKITANWHRVLEHFRAQVSVKYWFVSANLSRETQRLIENDTIRIDITGGTPTQKEKIYTFAEKIAARLFVPTLQPNPMPAHPTGSAVCVSLNYQRVEEDRTSIWSGSESEYEVKQLGLAVIIGDVPDEYFSGYNLSRLTGNMSKDSWIYSYASDQEPEELEEPATRKAPKTKKPSEAAV